MCEFVNLTDDFIWVAKIYSNERESKLPRAWTHPIVIAMIASAIIPTLAMFTVFDPRKSGRDSFTLRTEMAIWQWSDGWIVWVWVVVVVVVVCAVHRSRKFDQLFLFTLAPSFARSLDPTLDLTRIGGPFKGLEFLIRRREKKR